MTNATQAAATAHSDAAWNLTEAGNQAYRDGDLNTMHAAYDQSDQHLDRAIELETTAGVKQ